MKKSLLKASLICLGVTVLCGMSSFNSPKIETFQQYYQTAAISNDTIITPNGNESECIKEVAIKGDRGDCICSLIVEEGTFWSLKIEKSCSQSVRATFKCLIYFKNGTTRSYKDTKIISDGSTPITIPINTLSIEDRHLDNSRCVPEQIDACFVN